MDYTRGKNNRGRGGRGGYRGQNRGRGGNRKETTPKKEIDSDDFSLDYSDSDNLDLILNSPKPTKQDGSRRTNSSKESNNRRSSKNKSRRPDDKPRKNTSNVSYTSKSSTNAFNDTKIESSRDVFRELRDKQKPNLKNIDQKIFIQLDKFKRIVDFISSKQMKKQTLDGFFELCKVFTLPDLKNSKDIGKKSSIYAIFFDADTFKLSEVVKDAALDILAKNISSEKKALMFDFFKVLIDVSLNYYEIIKENLILFERLGELEPSLKVYVKDIHDYARIKEENEKNSFESVVSPTPEDLFSSKRKKIINLIDKPWDNFDHYKRTMIDLTKENFYTPFRNSLDKLKEKTLDPRDLFLYEDVYIPFTACIDNYKIFKDCNFFLSFKIRTPPNCKRKMVKPNWKKTEQLANRSLLILSTSAELLKIDAVCRSCALARSQDEIASRATINFLDRGIVPVVLISGQIKKDVKYYMFEPTSCWQAVQPILQRLMKMNEFTFPSYFLNKIIKLDFSKNDLDENNPFETDILMLDRPERERRNRYLKMASEAWEFDGYSSIQFNHLLRVDNEQYRALRYALKHNLTLVNGAPGTGKTHFAREYLRLMMTIRHPKPIVVVTFTNHALDSILEGVIDFIRPDDIVRWGGPMRSTNERLMNRKWRNSYFSKEILVQKNEIFTMKQNLKNMYNIRQMATQSIDAISRDPNNIHTYYEIMKVLNFFFKASEKMAQRYPIDLNQDEIKDYLDFLKSGDDRIKHISLPSIGDALYCWLKGEQYYQNRNLEIRKTYNHNKAIIIGATYQNPFQNLNRKEDDDYDYYDDSNENNQSNEKDTNNNEIKVEIHPNPNDFSVKVDNTKDEAQPAKINELDDEEEEEEEFDDKIYNDEDVVEMARVSFDGTEIEENLPKVYVTEVLEGRFNDLFAVKNPENKKSSAQLMIEYLKVISDPLTRMIDQLEKNLQKYEIDFADRETKDAAKYISHMKLIGMTSTVASVRKEALETASCEIMIVEEAGELTESMLSCILPSTLKRLILIGDYQQLRPKVEHEMTGNQLNYDVSLFEKLVVNAKNVRAPCLFTLSIQRRMHPQISALIRNVFYNEGREAINDAEMTNNHGIPYGIPYRVRFYMHNFEENKVVTSRSHENIQEAKFCASLVPFFICRGYKPEEITIISLYKGQMFRIQREIEDLYTKSKKSTSSKVYDPFGNIRSTKQIKVVVLDNFQGEENKIIIVSLTRSDKPGFVKNRNRALVTLSRAKEMLIVLGHERVFGPKCQNNEMWKKISSVAKSLSPYSMSNPDERGIAVNQCTIHKPNSSHIPAFLDTPDSILKYRFSFCKEKCNFKLPCSHICQLVCHCHSNPPGPNEHDDYYCPFRCLKRCPNNHQCKQKCGICTHKGVCPPCRELIHHVFPCKHEKDVECHLVTSGKAKCDAKCGKILKRCGHPCRLQCGHKSDCECKVQLEKECENCHRKFKYNCGDNNPKCMKRCTFTLPCGHTCSSKCFECIERHHHDTECHQKCEFIFPCGHRCQNLCCDKFPSHQHFICRKKTFFNHNFIRNHGLYNDLITECSLPITCNLPCEHFCNVCNKRCTKKCSDMCIERCNCRCRNRCQVCGKQCRALSGERCAIFCQHSQDFIDVTEPPEDDGLVYVFHGNHFLPLKEAKEKVIEQYESIIQGKGDVPVPVHRLTCPIEGCKSNETCILGSWLFDHYNKNIENAIKSIRNKSDRYIETHKNDPKETQFDKVHWYFCESCGELFFIKFNNIENIIVKCPKCGMQKGEIFE